MEIKAILQKPYTEKQRIDFICKFCGFNPTFESGYIISLDKTNLYYIEPNKAIIKDIFTIFYK